jgi:hypothetical protein
MFLPRRNLARFGVVLATCFFIAGTQVAISGTWLASAADAQGTVPDSCTLVPAARIAIAMGAPASKTLAGNLNQNSTSSGCSFTYDSATIDETLAIQIYPASQYAAAVHADSHYGKPTHPAGLGPKGVYFLNLEEGDASVFFIKGPYFVEILAELGPTHAAIVAGARRTLRLAPLVYAKV